MDYENDMKKHSWDTKELLMNFDIPYNFYLFKVDQKLREWNETWFGENRKIEIKKSVDVPDFLRKR